MSHSTIIKDNDPRFTIDEHTRAITQISDNPTKVMQGDHNSERFTFSMPRYIEGHDMTECNSVKIHYDITNPTTKEVITGAHEVKDMQVDPDDEATVLFTWLLSDWVTQLPGELSFLVEFKCINDNAETEYKWSTDKYEKISVTPGKNHGDEIITKYADILDQWKKDLNVDIGENIITDVKAYYIGSIDFDNKKIYLTKTKPVIPSLTEHIVDESILNDEEFYEVGDVFSIISEYHYPACGTITDIDDNRVITYAENLPFTEVHEDEGYDGNTFKVVQKPHIGCVTLGKYAFGAGLDNIIGGAAGIALGRDGVVLDDFGAVIGLGNIAGYSAVALNALTQAIAERSLSFGQRTKVLHPAKNGVAGGFYTVTGSENQFVFGKFNVVDNDGNYIFILGNGTNTNALSNAFTVDWNGNARFLGDVYVGKDKAKLIKASEVAKYVGTTLGENNTSDAEQVINIGYMSNLYGKGDISIGHRNSSEPEMVVLIGVGNNAKGTSGYGGAIGYGNLISHGQAYLLGKQLTSSEYEQIIVGRNNLAETDAIFIVGNGANATNRANAFKIKKTTNEAYFAGDIYSKDKKVATQAEIDALNQKITELENERQALNDSISFMYNDINALTERVTALESKA